MQPTSLLIRCIRHIYTVVLKLKKIAHCSSKLKQYCCFFTDVVLGMLILGAVTTDTALVVCCNHTIFAYTKV